MSSTSQRARIVARLRRERGTRFGRGRRQLVLASPSSYAVGMSSLGFQWIYGLANELPDTAAERTFLPDSAADDTGPVLTYESSRPLGDFRVVAFSVAYELELAGVLTVLERSGVPVAASERRERDPFVVVGGPLTFANPLPLAPFADAIVMGEGDELLAPLLDTLFSAAPRADVLRSLTALASVYVPALQGDVLPPVARAPQEILPAASAVMTPEAVLADMFLVEAERGCSRGCTFCTMRRVHGGGMRIVPAARVLANVPALVGRVGLVGAAVSDHPELLSIVGALVADGKEVSLSSLRADRVTPELVHLLRDGGLKTLTVAADGASERLREGVAKGITAADLVEAARLAAGFGIPQVKTYAMVGLPGETEADIDELAALALAQAAAARPRTKVCLAVSPFVPKRNTPLAEAAFAGVPVASERLERLRRALTPHVEVRGTSPRWAWVEYELARGGREAGLAALRAHGDGGAFAAWKRALAALPAPGVVGPRREEREPGMAMALAARSC